MRKHTLKLQAFSKTMLPEKEFKQWLNTPENFCQLKHLAKILRKKLESAHLRLPGADPFPNSENTEEIILQELTLYLLTNPDLQQTLVLNVPEAVGKITRYFLNHTQDLIRSKTNTSDIYKDNWRSFRRHAWTVLQGADHLKKFKSGKELSFALSDNSPSVFIPTEKMKYIPYPDSVSSNHEKMNHKKQILKLADHFLAHCAVLADVDHVRISLNDFISWIGTYVSLQITPSDSPSGSKPMEDIIHNTKIKLDSQMKKTYLKTWAQNFFNRLMDREKQIFYYYDCQGLTGAEVAQLMGKKSNLNYQRDKIRDTLKEFLCPLEWISPEPLTTSAADPDAFIFFMGELCNRLGQKLGSLQKVE